jgi:3-oxoacyl-[acyl-carrier-protein] synthase II
VSAVAVTGWALRTPLGSSVETVVSRWLAGERAAARNTRFPSESFRCSLAATIVDDPVRSPHERVLRRMGLFAVEVAREAAAMSRCELGERLGVFCGMGGLRVHWEDLMPALSGQDPTFDGSWHRGLKRLHPLWMLSHLSNNAHAIIARELDARGDGITVSGSNAGAQALVAATCALEAGVIDAALVVAYDSLLEPETLVEMGERGALSTSKLEDLTAPYAVDARGSFPGEAAAAVVLEREERAGERRLARVSANVGADGSPGPAAVAAERHSLAPLLGPSARLTSLAASTGQLGAATSVVQIVALAGCLRVEKLPPIAHLFEAPPGPLVPRTQAERTDATSAMALSTGAPGLVGAVAVSVDATAS